MLSDKQKAFLSEQESFIVKNEVDEEVNRLLYGLQQAVASVIKDNHVSLPGKLGKTPFKVNKGNNHKGFPFQVFDFPASLGQENVYSFRAVIWYANFFSFNLILKGKPKMDYLPRLSNLTDKGFQILGSDKIWDTEIGEALVLDVCQEKFDEVLGIFEKFEAIKLFKSYNLNQIDQFERLGIECLKDIFSVD